jgi:CPA2 family monovalent cation:H+ antiporter-2
MDLDPLRVRSARAAGLPVIYGDASDVDLLREVGLKTANAVVITFADPAIAIGILRAIRSLRDDVPVLVRTADDSRVADLMAAGATEVVPETFETSLMLASHALMLLNQPVSRVVRTIGNIRSDRYASLRGLLRGESDLPDEETEADAASIRTVVIPPGAWAVDQSLSDVVGRGVEVRFRSVLRHGVLGNDPDLSLRLRVGDEIVCAGSPEALEHAEKVLLAG